MRPRNRSHAASAAYGKPGWLILAASGAILALAVAAHAESGAIASDAVPPAGSPAAPAEIQPGHPPPATTGSTGSSGPQAVAPSPLPPGARADTPGGSSRDGVISPPSVGGDHDINRGAPGAGALGTPVIPPPGSPGGNPKVVPK